MAASTPLLLIETSTEACSVAVADLVKGSWQVLAKAEDAGPMKHTARLVPLIRAAFAKTPYAIQEVGSIGVSAGPGSYTALRAGLSTAKGLCFATGAKLLMLPTLEAMAACVFEQHGEYEGAVLSLINARRDEVYYATYSHQLDVLDEPACAALSQEWVEQRLIHGELLATGNGATKAADYFDDGLPQVLVELNACTLLPLAVQRIDDQRFASLHHAVPNYIRPPYITVAKPRL